MLSGRPATGFHQPLGECQWRNEGGCRRRFPMGVQAGMQLQARHACTDCSSAKLCPVPWKPNKNSRSELTILKLPAAAWVLWHWQNSHRLREVFNFCTQFLLKWGPSVHTSYLFLLSAKMKAWQSFACIPFLQWHFTGETRLGDCYRHFRHCMICLLILALYFNT